MQVWPYFSFSDAVHDCSTEAGLLPNEVKLQYNIVLFAAFDLLGLAFGPSKRPLSNKCL